MKTRVDIEEIKRLFSRIAEINALPFSDIEFYENGIPVQIDEKVVKNWKFTGLTNVHFIDTGFYQEDPNSF